MDPGHDKAPVAAGYVVATVADVVVGVVAVGVVAIADVVGVLVGPVHG